MKNAGNKSGHQNLNDSTQLFSVQYQCVHMRLALLDIPLVLQDLNAKHS